MTDQYPIDVQQNESLIAVIRSAGERTLDRCLTLLKPQINPANIHIVKVVPFEEALRQTYFLGSKSSAKWMLTVDADILLFPEAVSKLLKAAEQMPEHYVQIEGRIFDKVFGLYRPAGVRIYRTKFLQEAMRNIPPFGKALRPEYHTLTQLGKLGFPSRRVPTVVGLHDFEQYYGDLYRKAFVHAKKHNYLAIPLIERCIKKRSIDPDFSVILKGIFDGHSYHGNVEINANLLIKESSMVLAALGLAEKHPLAELTCSERGSWFSGCMEGDAPSVQIEDEHLLPKTLTRLERFAQILEEYGPMGTARFLIAAVILRVGYKIQPRRPAG